MKGRMVRVSVIFFLFKRGKKHGLRKSGVVSVNSLVSLPAPEIFSPDLSFGFLKKRPSPSL